jgi:hypothetical protein
MAAVAEHGRVELVDDVTGERRSSIARQEGECDASVDALSRCGRCDGYDPCLRCSDLGQIDRLKAEAEQLRVDLQLVEAGLGIKVEQLRLENEAHAATTAKLGRAVACLLDWDASGVKPAHLDEVWDDEESLVAGKSEVSK